jgi:hypothetical protein
VDDTTKFEDKRLQALSSKLSGTHKKADTTVTGYTHTARTYLTWLKDSPMDTASIDSFIADRRKNGFNERSLRTEFNRLKFLFRANNIPWTFTADDAPQPAKDDHPNQPILLPDQIDYLIMNQHKYSPGERLYLAISTTWAARAEAMSRLNKRLLFPDPNFENLFLTIPGVKHEESVTHLIPGILEHLFKTYKLRLHETRALALMFHRIVDAAGLKLEGSGYGFHSIRRGVSTVILHALPMEKRIYWSYSTGWSTQKIGRVYYGSTTAGVYDHPEILNKDPHWIDREIYQVHPFLKSWEKALKENPIQMQASESSDDRPESCSEPEPAPMAGTQSPLDKFIEKLRNGG